MPKDSPITESLPEASVRPQGMNQPPFVNRGKPETEQPSSNCFIDENSEPNSSPVNGCLQTTSILLEPSEYFFDDDFSVPFDANLRDETPIRRGLIEESDEGISSSGTINRGLTVPAHSRSDSCLFSQPDSGDSGQSGPDQHSGQRFESPINATSNGSSHMFAQKMVCSPDSTSNNLAIRPPQRIHRTMSADFSTALHELNETDKLFDNSAIIFGELPQTGLNDPSSVTTSWMQAVLEGSSCPQLKELLKRTAEALDYRLAWGEVQLGPEEGGASAQGITSPRTGRLQRSTSHGNILSAASLAGMRQALANIKVAAPKQFRSVGVATSDNERSCDDVSLPDTTTTTATTTWARIRSSRESLNSKRGIPPSEATVIPPPPTQKSNAPTDLPESAVTWRAVKEAAGSELTTWGQLRRTASLGNRKARKEAAKKMVPSNMHVSLLPNNFGIPLRSPVSQKAMHRYSGTLLEIFMRARAHDLVSSSYMSSVITDTAHGGPPRILKQLGPSIIGDAGSTNRSMSTRSLQTNVSILSIGTETEHTPIGAVRRPTTGPFKMGVPPPKNSSQPPPIVPPRRSSVASPQRVLYVNRSGGTACLGRPIPAMPPMSLLTMSADPESECMSRLREGSPLTYIKNPRAAIVYPGLGKMSIPKPSRIESNTFLSQTLPDLSLLGKAAAQEAKSGTPTTTITQPSVSRRAASVASVSRRRTSGGINSNRCGSRNSRQSDIEALRRRMSGVDPNRTPDLMNDPRKSAPPVSSRFLARNYTCYFDT